MSTAKYVGNPALAVSVRTERDPARGILQVAEYNYATEAAADSAISSLVDDQRYVKERDGAHWRLLVYTPDNNGPTYDQNDVYELLANHVEKDLYEHPTSKSISENEIRLIRKHLKNPQDGVSPALTDPNAIKLYTLLLQGTTKFPDDEWVFRYTVTVSSRALLNASMTNCGKLFTNAQLIDVAKGGVVIPSGVGFAIGDIPAKTPPTDYVWKWLKRSPTVRQTQYGKVTISQEFWLDLWSTYIYTAVV